MQIIPASIFSDIPSLGSQPNSSDSSFEHMLSGYMDAGQESNTDTQESYADYPYNPEAVSYSVFSPQVVRYTPSELEALSKALSEAGVSSEVLNVLNDLMGVPGGPSTDQLLSEIYGSMEHVVSNLSEQQAASLSNLSHKIAGGGFANSDGSADGDVLFNTLLNSSPEAGLDALLKAMKDPQGVVISPNEMSALLKHLNLPKHVNEEILSDYTKLMANSKNGLISPAELEKMFGAAGTEFALKKDAINTLNNALEKNLKGIMQDASKREEFERMSGMHESKDVANARIMIEDTASQAALGRSDTMDQDKQTRAVVKKPSDSQIADQVNKQASDQVNEQANGQMNKQINNPLNVQASIQVDEQINDQISNQINEQVNIQTSNQINDQISSQLNSQLKEQANSQLKEQANSQLKEQANSQLKEQANSQLNNQINGQFNNQAGAQASSQFSSQASNFSNPNLAEQNLAKQNLNGSANQNIDKVVENLMGSTVGQSAQLGSNKMGNLEGSEGTDSLGTFEFDSTAAVSESKSLEELIEVFNQSSSDKENNSSDSFLQNDTVSSSTVSSSADKAASFTLKTEVPSLPQETLKQIQETVLSMAKNGTQRLEVALNPLELGSLVIMLTSRNGEISATIQADRAESAQLIQQHSQAILLELENNGIKVEKLEVQTQVADHNSQDNQENWGGMDKHNQQQEQEENIKYFDRLRNMRALSGQGEDSLAQDMQYSIQSPTNSANIAGSGLHVVA